MTMRKLSWGGLVIEPSRRCNMVPPCLHCMRGNPQPIDLSTDAIDAVLNQTELIRQLIYSGGEPFTNIPLMEYVLQELKRRDIPLYCASFYTNGLVGADKIAEVAREYYEYCTRCRQRDDYKNTGIPVNIYISIDRFHLHKSFAGYTIKRLREMLDGVAGITANGMGELPADIGRASIFLRGKEDLIPSGNHVSIQQVAIHDATHRPICQCYQSFPLAHKDQTWICYDVVLTARGTLCHMNPIGKSGYQAEDDPRNIICAVETGSIFENILTFNADKLDCIDAEVKNFQTSPQVNYILEHFGQIRDWQLYKLGGLDTALDQPTDISALERLAMGDPFNMLSLDFKCEIIENMKTRMRSWDGHTITDKSIIERDAALKCKHLNEVRQQTADDMTAIEKIWAAKE